MRARVPKSRSKFTHTFFWEVCSYPCVTHVEEQSNRNVTCRLVQIQGAVSLHGPQIQTPALDSQTFFTPTPPHPNTSKKGTANISDLISAEWLSSTVRLRCNLVRILSGTQRSLNSFWNWIRSLSQDKIFPTTCLLQLRKRLTSFWSRWKLSFLSSACIIELCVLYESGFSLRYGGRGRSVRKSVEGKERDGGWVAIFSHRPGGAFNFRFCPDVGITDCQTKVSPPGDKY